VQSHVGAPDEQPSERGRSEHTNEPYAGSGGSATAGGTESPGS
jgi:hypothetical protein